MKDCLFLGVVGNIAGHLEQAKEAKIFKDISKDINAPKGLFVIYSKDAKNFLNRYCISKNELLIESDFVQIEPELGFMFEAVYENDLIKDLKLKYFAAFNDASKRIEAEFISVKKNFSKASKGLANLVKISDFYEISEHKISCFLKRDGQIRAYGKTEFIKNYHYYGAKLVNWLIDRINNQKTQASLEEIKPFIASKPKEIFVSIGATTYTDYAVSNYLKENDEIYVIIHNLSEDEALKNINNKDKFASYLHQKVLKDKNEK